MVEERNLPAENGWKVGDRSSPTIQAKSGALSQRARPRKRAALRPLFRFILESGLLAELATERQRQGAEAQQAHRGRLRNRGNRNHGAFD